MSIVLPAAIDAYFAADRQDGGAGARCFTDDAVVKDEGQIHAGREAIAAWKAAASAKYTYSSEPVALDEENGFTIVTCHVRGDFPGSPIDLRYFFRFDGDAIASLEIKP